MSQSMLLISSIYNIGIMKHIWLYHHQNTFRAKEKSLNFEGNDLGDCHPKCKTEAIFYL